MLWPFRLHLLLHRRHLEPWWKALWSRKNLHFWTSEVMVMEISALQALKLAEHFLSVLFLWNSCSTLQTLRKAEDWQPLRRHFRWISLSSRGESDKSTSHWGRLVLTCPPNANKDWSAISLFTARSGAILGFSANDGRFLGFCSELVWRILDYTFHQIHQHPGTGPFSRRKCLKFAGPFRKQGRHIQLEEESWGYSMTRSLCKFFPHRKT